MGIEREMAGLGVIPFLALPPIIYSSSLKLLNGRLPSLKP